MGYRTTFSVYVLPSFACLYSTRVVTNFLKQFSNDKSSHFLLFASAVKRISHECVHKMIKLEAFLMFTTAQED